MNDFSTLAPSPAKPRQQPEGYVCDGENGWAAPGRRRRRQDRWVWWLAGPEATKTLIWMLKFVETQGVLPPMP